MSIERVGEGLQTLNEILGRPQSDPDPERQDWGIHAETLDTLVTTVEQEILAPFDAALTELDDSDDPEDREQTDRLRSVVADRVGDAAGLLIAARRPEVAQRLLQSACGIARPGPVANLCAAGLADPRRFTQIIRAWWLVHHERRKEAVVVAQAVLEGAPSAIAESAQQIIDAPTPISSPPTLFGINGFGLRVYGSRDRRPNGTYVTTRYITALFVPLLPLDAYRVASADDGEGWYFLAKEPLSSLTRWWRRLALVALVAAVGWGVVGGYLGSTGYRLNQAIETAQAAEAQASPEDRAALVDRYEAIIGEFSEEGPASLQPAVEGFIRTGTAMVESPLTIRQLGDVKRFVLRYRALPEVARHSSLAPLMLAKLEGWVDELGTDGPDPILGAIELLGHAEAIAPPSDTLRIRERRRTLNRALAAGLADEWPLEAIRQYTAMPGDPEALTAAAALLDTLGDGPSVWIELAPTVERWQQAARAVDPLASSRRAALAHVEAAQARVADPQRQALLDQPEAQALEAAIAAHPGDQELAVALADLRLAEGNAQGALDTLTAIGPPGRMVLATQAALASAQADTGHEAQADALLERVLSSRLPAFESARRAYQERASSMSDTLVKRAQKGTLPPDIMRRLQATPESEQPRVFSEWLDEQLDKDGALTRLRDEYTSLTGVVGIAIQWGTLKLRRANAVQGPERQALLDGAERAFLAISSEGTGIPSYHLGLGQVYYRLGRENEGEHEFANLLDDDPLEIQLAVARAYRDLGLMARARQVAQKVYDGAEESTRQNAAVLMALLVNDRDESRTWLQRGDTQSPIVKLRLLDYDAQERVEAGDYREADAMFAKIAKGWTEQSSHSSAAANNGALALLSRYQCTGDSERLREAVRLLDKARNLEPDSALVVGNLASAVELLARVEILEDFIRPELLRADASDLDDLMDAMLTSTQRPALLTAMGNSQSLRRALDLRRQEQVLGPKNPDSYNSLIAWYGRSEDAKSLEQLARSLDGVKLDLSQREAALAEALDPSNDAEQLEQMDQRLKHYASLEAALERRGHRPTRAALRYLQGDMQRAIASLRRDPQLGRQAAQQLARAHEQWDGIDTDAQAWTLVQIALLEAATGSDALRAAYDEHYRLLNNDGFLAWLLTDDGDALAALRARPELAEAAALRRGLPAERLQAFDWLLGLVTGDAELSATGRTAMARPHMRIGYELSGALMPGSKRTELILDLLDAQ